LPIADQGDNNISIFDRNDREVLSEEEIERFGPWIITATVQTRNYSIHATVYD